MGQGSPHVLGFRRRVADDGCPGLPVAGNGVQLQPGYRRSLLGSAGEAGHGAGPLLRAPGPVSLDEGFGFWWHCAITVQTADGRQVDTTVGHSVVTPADQGKAVESRELCPDSQCSYGRPQPEIFDVVLPANFIVGQLLTVVFGLLGLVSLVRVVTGSPKSERSG